MMLGKKAYSIIVSTQDDLEKLCDWYEQDDNQTTALEEKVQQFLKLWSLDRLKNLTIEDYHQAKNKDCFIAQIDSFDPTQGEPTFANYFDIWEPINLGKDEKYHNEKPYSWHKRLGDNLGLAFETLKQEVLDIVDAVQRRDLNAIDQIQFPKGLKWTIAFLYQDFNDPCIIPIVSKVNTKRIGYDHLYPKLPLPEFLPLLLADKGEQAFFPYVEKLFAMIRKGYLDNKQKKQQTQELLDDVMTQQPLNRILFGAAGTGKTFHTINHALSIIENKPLEVLEQEERTALKLRFDQYKEQGQIKFVTFHQSFSYEDFVEGIRAETDDNGQLNYDVKDGVFKEICSLAKGQYLQNDRFLYVPIEFGRGYKLLQVTADMLELEKPNGNIFHLSKKLADFLLDAYRNKQITLKNLSDKEVIDVLGNHSILEPYLVNGYNTVWANLIPLLDENPKQSQYKDSGDLPYVLIIDEINRGNISRIFGELITLIEDSKRQGAEEELSVTLPYSKEEFSVPSNVYLIGTMNSSDRSLTGLDIALRRRFTFVEMPPKPELLNDIKVEGLNIGEMLKVINQRIEVLLDRDHCIGHANFMSLQKQPTLEHLAAIFKQKIIPQLQEYFFDDWAKINMVLNANGMLKAKLVERSVLFPNVESDSDGFFEEQKTWQLNETAFDSIASFSKIIKH
nr:AAA family ATPase [Acinetobacter sp. NCu2D-2]